MTETTEPQERFKIVDVETVDLVTIKIRAPQAKAADLAEAARKARENGDEKGRLLFRGVIFVDVDPSLDGQEVFKCEALIPKDRFTLAMAFLKKSAEESRLVFEDLEVAEPEIPVNDHHHRRKHRGPGGL